MPEKKRGVFLDRDGVLSRVIHRDGKACSARSLEEFELLPALEGSLETLAKAGYVLLVVTNQPDVRRGLMPLPVLESMNRRLMDRFGSRGVRKVYFCPHDDSDRCGCRKPAPGMLLEGAREWDLDLSRSFMVGDRRTDAEAGRRAGCKTLLIRTEENRDARPDYWAEDLADACRIILSLP